ncbi:MAG: ribonuclease P protein component [Muribaculaceae bacterium]|nr:ribonuclease P protein component [Muribaculaceae bacterium]
MLSPVLNTSAQHTLPVKGLRLYKREKLCSPTAIDRLFIGGRRASTHQDSRSGDVCAALVYPLKLVWAVRPEGVRPSAPAVQFIISIPKKRIRHAVDRVTLRRRVREAFRLVRLDFETDYAHPLDIAFIWVANEKVDSARIQRAVRRLLDRLPKKDSTAQ